MSDGHYDAPAYCGICDRPILTGPICDACERIDDDDEFWSLSEDLDFEDRAQLAFTTMMNGNLTDGINLIMRDGDVRADSVKAALRLVGHYYDSHTRDTHQILALLINIIDIWETK